MLDHKPAAQTSKVTTFKLLLRALFVCGLVVKVFRGDFFRLTAGSSSTGQQISAFNALRKVGI